MMSLKYTTLSISMAFPSRVQSALTSPIHHKLLPSVPCQVWLPTVIAVLPVALLVIHAQAVHTLLLS